MNLFFPFSVDATGRSAGVADDVHVRQMIEQVLLTSRGERVNRPDFGSDLMQMVFAPNSSELATALQMTLQATLRQHLGDLINVSALDIETDDATFRVSVQYVLLSTGETGVAQFRTGT